MIIILFKNQYSSNLFKLEKRKRQKKRDGQKGGIRSYNRLQSHIYF